MMKLVLKSVVLWAWLVSNTKPVWAQTEPTIDPPSAISDSQVRQLSDEARQAQRQRAHRLKVIEGSQLLQWLDSLEPEDNAQALTPAPQPSIDRPTPTQTTTKNETKSTERPPPPTLKPRPRPSRPVAPTTARGFQVGSLSFDKTLEKYGVLFDQWMKAELRNTITSQDQAPVKLYLTEPIRGQNKTVPIETILVGTHRFDTSTQRLFIAISQLHLPDGKIVRLRASVYDQAKKFGLTGTIVTDEERRLDYGRELAGRSALNTLTGLALPQVPDLLSKTVDTGVKALQSTQAPVSKPKAYLTIDPQPVFINVEAAF